MKTNQKGFELVSILVIFVIVGLVGAIGWLVYDRQKSNKAADTTSTQQEPKVETVPDPSEESTANTEYLIIKEWGVKIPLTETTKNASYLYKNGYVYLNVGIEGDEDNACTEQAAVSKITKYSEDADNWRERPSELDEVASKIGNTYYLIEGSQSMCSETETVQAKASAVRTEWLKQGKNITLSE
jgi:flagellar basal body-associated protein FliL